jgi:multidrug resistance efflux pump
MGALLRVLATTAIVLVAVGAAAYKYWDYVTNPWTRDGVVRAQVIQIASRVSGPIVKLPIKDNQLVKQGDLLFEIDPRTFDSALDSARAGVDKTRDDIKALEEQVRAARASVTQYDALVEQAKIEVDGYAANFKRARGDFERAEKLITTGNIARQQYDALRASSEIAEDKLTRARSHMVEVTAAKEQAEAGLARAVANLGAPGENNAQLRAAKAALESAELNREFTQVKAPVNGYVTNLQLRVGDQAVANQPALALIDTASFYVHGFFRETFIGEIRPGNRAVVTLMSHPDLPLEGRVDSVGRGIAQQDGSPGYQLLPSVSPSFEWIRLAQRIPVRIHLEEVPAEVELIVGATASVLVASGTGEGDTGGATPAAPKSLQ